MNTKKYMLNVLKNHRIYESFTCRDDAGSRIKYDLLAEEPPVGLLHDIAVRETELTVNEKNTAMEMFSAYCLYHGAKILGKKDGDDVLNYTLVQAAMSTIDQPLMQPITKRSRPCTTALSAAAESSVSATAPVMPSPAPGIGPNDGNIRTVLRRTFNTHIIM